MIHSNHQLINQSITALISAHLTRRTRAFTLPGAVVVSLTAAAVFSPAGGRFKKEIVVDGQSHLLLIRDEGGPPEAQVSTVPFGVKLGQVSNLRLSRQKRRDGS